MKKLTLLASPASLFLSLIFPVSAQAVEQSLPIKITPPSTGVKPEASPGTVISNAITIIFVVAIVVVLFMLAWGAFQWIFSGGDKEAVGKARGRIIHALVGLLILALAFLLARLAGIVANVDLLNLVLPSLNLNT